MALVSQEPILFARSIRENIAYGLAEDDGWGAPPTQVRALCGRAVCGRDPRAWAALWLSCLACCLLLCLSIANKGCPLCSGALSG
jgi:ABC-type multidrug transport system fused ATPase/permease subunit